ncbi:MAG: creatininase family protein, partial [Candidatus Latescibacteria bacterium]|nr:creatininase family protein [Candidatus Latescibacterota bacterium]
MIWADQTWVDLTAVPEESVVVLPLASCEQHGLHLPVLTDTYIITHIAKKLEAAMPSKVWLMPTLWVGASHHHRAFPGTISLPETLYMQVVRERVDCVL